MGPRTLKSQASRTEASALAWRVRRASSRQRQEKAIAEAARPVRVTVGRAGGACRQQHQMSRDAPHWHDDGVSFCIFFCIGGKVRVLYGMQIYMHTDHIDKRSELISIDMNCLRTFDLCVEG